MDQPVIGYTNQICEKTGTYQCENHQTFYITVNQGDLFPTCTKNANDPHDATWVFVKKDS